MRSRTPLIRAKSINKTSTWEPQSKLAKYLTRRGARCLHNSSLIHIRLADNQPRRQIRKDPRTCYCSGDPRRPRFNCGTLLQGTGGYCKGLGKLSRSMVLVARARIKNDILNHPSRHGSSTWPGGSHCISDDFIRASLEWSSVQLCSSLGFCIHVSRR
jgi:hypothetical protein